MAADPWFEAYSQHTDRETLRKILQLALEAHRRMVEQMDIAELRNMDEQRLRQTAAELISEIELERRSQLSGQQRAQAVQLCISEIRGYGPLDPLLADDEVTEIMVNGPDTVYVERGGKLYKTNVLFADDQHLLRIIDRIVSPLGRRLDEASPMVDARLPDGSRVNAIIPPVSLVGPCLTIRKFSRDPYTVEDLIHFGTLTEEMADFLRAAVQSKLNILVSGGTGSGKTTTLNVLSSFIPDGERIITIEDAAELQLQQEHVITLEARPPNLEGKGEITIRQLVRNALRMRPDRIIVGEVRGAEALDMLQAMNTGHEGSLSTLHANSPRDALSRLETMVLMAGTELPSRAIREQIASALDLIVHQARLRDGSRKIVSITEVQHMEGDMITIQELFRFEQRGVDDQGRVVGEHLYTGLRPLFAERLIAEGVELPSALSNRWAA